MCVQYELGIIYFVFKKYECIFKDSAGSLLGWLWKLKGLAINMAWL